MPITAALLCIPVLMERNVVWYWFDARGSLSLSSRSRRCELVVGEMNESLNYRLYFGEKAEHFRAPAEPIWRLFVITRGIDWSICTESACFNQSVQQLSILLWSARPQFVRYTGQVQRSLYKPHEDMDPHKIFCRIKSQISGGP